MLAIGRMLTFTQILGRWPLIDWLIDWLQHLSSSYRFLKMSVSSPVNLLLAILAYSVTVSVYSLFLLKYRSEGAAVMACPGEKIIIIQKKTSSVLVLVFLTWRISYISSFRFLELALFGLQYYFFRSSNHSSPWFLSNSSLFYWKTHLWPRGLHCGIEGNASETFGRASYVCLEDCLWKLWKCCVSQCSDRWRCSHHPSSAPDGIFKGYIEM